MRAWRALASWRLWARTGPPSRRWRRPLPRWPRRPRLRVGHRAGFGRGAAHAGLVCCGCDPQVGGPVREGGGGNCPPRPPRHCAADRRPGGPGTLGPAGPDVAPPRRPG
eukprot:9213719-Alexandrium_andersonii.AAC.1